MYQCVPISFYILNFFYELNWSMRSSDSISCYAVQQRKVYSIWMQLISALVDIRPRLFFIILCTQALRRWRKKRKKNKQNNTTQSRKKFIETLECAVCVCVRWHSICYILLFVQCKVYCAWYTQATVSHIVASFHHQADAFGFRFKIISNLSNACLSCMSLKKGTKQQLATIKTKEATA